MKGATQAAVEAAVAELVQQGCQQLETIRPLGHNWVATVRRPPEPRDETWCEVTSIGLQAVIEASHEQVAREKIQELTTFGAALIAGPEYLEGKWVAVVDRKAVAPGGRR